MNKRSWMEIEAGLKRRKAPLPRHNSESFNQDFKARAVLMRQDPPHPPQTEGFPLLRWSMIGASVAALLVAGFLTWPTSSSLVTQIKSLHITVPHSGVIIMTDDVNQGTVVWVTDLESEDGNKG